MFGRACGLAPDSHPEALQGLDRWEMGKTEGLFVKSNVARPSVSGETVIQVKIEE